VQWPVNGREAKYRDNSRNSPVSKIGRSKSSGVRRSAWLKCGQKAQLGKAVPGLKQAQAAASILAHQRANGTENGVAHRARPSPSA